MKWVISMNNLVYLLLLHPGRQGRNLIIFSKKKPAPYFSRKRKFNKPVEKMFNKKSKQKNKIEKQNQYGKN